MHKIQHSIQSRQPHHKLTKQMRQRRQLQHINNILSNYKPPLNSYNNNNHPTNHLYFNIKHHGTKLIPQHHFKHLDVVVVDEVVSLVVVDVVDEVVNLVVVLGVNNAEMHIAGHMELGNMEVMNATHQHLATNTTQHLKIKWVVL